MTNRPNWTCMSYWSNRPNWRDRRCWTYGSDWGYRRNLSDRANWPERCGGRYMTYWPSLSHRPDRSTMRYWSRWSCRRNGTHRSSLSDLIYLSYRISVSFLRRQYRISIQYHNDGRRSDEWIFAIQSRNLCEHYRDIYR